MNNSQVLAAQKVFTLKLKQSKYKSFIYEAIDSMRIDEVQKEFAAMENLTPVAKLHLFLTRRHILDHYEMIERGGLAHEPIFKYRMYFNNKEAIGAGNSKQEAKQKAALVMIQKLSGERVIECNVTPSHMVQIKNVVENPIGWLQEYCTKSHCQLPVYAEMKSGSSNFKYSCTLYEHTEFGEAPSKKLAKKKAADAMWKALNNSNSSWAHKLHSSMPS